jgi:hypothetical protein
MPVINTKQAAFDVALELIREQIKAGKYKDPELRATSRELVVQGSAEKGGLLAARRSVLAATASDNARTVKKLLA